MATRNLEHEHREHERRVRDEPPAGGDRFARESLGWRRMKPYQIWASVIGAAAFIILGLFLLY